MEHCSTDIDFVTGGRGKGHMACNYVYIYKCILCICGQSDCVDFTLEFARSSGVGK